MQHIMLPWYFFTLPLPYPSYDTAAHKTVWALKQAFFYCKQSFFIASIQVTDCNYGLTAGLYRKIGQIGYGNSRCIHYVVDLLGVWNIFCFSIQQLLVAWQTDQHPLLLVMITYQTTRNNRRRRCKIVAAFCITFWLVAVAIAIAVAFLVQNAVRSKKGVNVTLSPLNETLANSTVTSVIGWGTVSNWQRHPLYTLLNNTCKT